MLNNQQDFNKECCSSIILSVFKRRWEYQNWKKATGTFSILRGEHLWWFINNGMKLSFKGEKKVKKYTAPSILKAHIGTVVLINQGIKCSRTCKIINKTDWLFNLKKSYYDVLTKRWVKFGHLWSKPSKFEGFILWLTSWNLSSAALHVR